MSIKNEKQCRKNGLEVKEISKEFVENCGLHGINKIKSDGRSSYRRLVWLILILGSASYLAYSIINELQNYYTYPTTTTVQVKRSQSMDFPAVTLCNLSPYNKSKLPTDERYTNYRMKYEDIWQFFAKPMNLSDPYYQSIDFVTPISPDLIKNLSMEGRKMFTYCEFDGIPLNCGARIEPIITESGLCYIFNKDGKQKTVRSGANVNLAIYVFIDSKNYYFGMGLGSGMKIVVHDPHDIPNVKSDGFVVSPGMEAIAAVKPTVIKNLAYPYKSFSDDNCIDTEAEDFKNPLKYLNYSWTGCTQECKTDYIRTISECVIPKHDHEDPPYCSLANMSTYSKAAFDAFLKPKLFKECSDKCRTSCLSKQFETKVSYAKYPSDFSNQMLKTLFNVSREYLGNNYLSINIFLERLETTYWEQTALYKSVGDILANVGGQMGLFLGASLLTLTEIMEFLLTIILHFVRRKTAIPKQNENLNEKTNENNPRF